MSGHTLPCSQPNAPPSVDIAPCASHRPGRTWWRFRKLGSNTGSSRQKVITPEVPTDSNASPARLNPTAKAAARCRPPRGRAAFRRRVRSARLPRGVTPPRHSAPETISGRRLALDVPQLEQWLRPACLSGAHVHQPRIGSLRRFHRRASGQAQRDEAVQHHDAPHLPPKRRIVLLQPGQVRGPAGRTAGAVSGVATDRRSRRCRPRRAAARRHGRPGRRCRAAAGRPSSSRTIVVGQVVERPTPVTGPTRAVDLAQGLADQSPVALQVDLRPQRPRRDHRHRALRLGDDATVARRSRTP